MSNEDGKHRDNGDEDGEGQGQHGCDAAVYSVHCHAQNRQASTFARKIAQATTVSGAKGASRARAESPAARGSLPQSEDARARGAGGSRRGSSAHWQAPLYRHAIV
jgi:hypothetical protein